MANLEEDSNDLYHIDALPAPRDGGNRVLKCGDTFAVLDSQGDILSRSAHQHGLYHDGTRYLSHLQLSLGRHDLLPLGVSLRHENIVLNVDLTNPDLYNERQLSVPHGTIHISRSKFLQPGHLYERTRVTNYGNVACEVELTLRFGADFVDLFEVRGTRRKTRGELLGTETQADSVTMSYRGLDGLTRSTHLHFDPSPARVSKEIVVFKLQLAAKEERLIHVIVQCAHEAPNPPTVSYEIAYSRAHATAQALEMSDASIYSSNEQFNDWTNRSLADLRMMLSPTGDGLYPHAGVPWYCTPFGRDGVITALQTLWINPDIAAGVLKFLARNQADEVDPIHDAEPGKILHETRMGEMANLGEIPFGKYYGSVDSTPLFVMLAGAYYNATGDQETIEKLWPHIERALLWIDRWGDKDGDGFVEYDRQSDLGLVHQGWKDSHDSVFHADGTSAQSPIALCEVQGYVYAARRNAAHLARVLGHTARADQLRLQAEQLQEKFDKIFWCEEISMYALALDGNKQQCKVRSSNAGHCLFTGIALPQRAKPLAEQLVSDEMFSGWGIRTLARSEQRYNPMAYHNGSVWPHDNALIAEGFAHYGLIDKAQKLLAGLFDASLFVELHRLPELFCGFPRRPAEGPVLYPVACSPQAWAAAAPLLMLKATLGLRVDANECELIFDHPAMPSFLDSLLLRNVRVGAHSVNLELHRYPENVAVNVLSRSGNVEVVVTS
ncbi:MAG TPA: amylo-alpha-1,6-glucosidase [Polyangiaceae bacterium]|nr:amylo-alpha-1,6-glucosidase [Polyangiaceae bacterium]